MKQSVSDLAVFGGLPLFSRPRPTGQFNTPDVDAYIAQLRGIYERRWLTNAGHCVRELEDALVRFHGTRHCVAVCNAATGLMMLLQAVGGVRPGEIIMPALAYRGLPHFARWAGHAPRFADVDGRTHTLSVTAVREQLSGNTRCILGMPSLTSVGHIGALCRLGEEAGVPVVFDSVDAMACTYEGRQIGGFGAAEVFSLHASKLVNAFEGGYITTNDDALAEVLRRQRDFNYPGLAPEMQRAPRHVIGLNAKLNELHAALALLSLRDIERRIADNRARYTTYVAETEGIPGISVVPYDAAAGEARNYRSVVVRFGPEWPLTRDRTVAVLAAEGAVARTYFAPPLHRMAPWVTDLPACSLPVTEALAEGHCQMPVGEMTAPEDIARIADLLRFLAAEGPAVAARLERS